VISHRDTTISSARRERFLHYNYPLEQLARSASTRFQLGFARMTMHLMPDLQDVVLEATPQGLKIFGAHELALAPVALAMRQIHGSDVQFDEPTVRLFYGDVIHEPIMWLRLALDGAYTERVIRDLVARSAEIDVVDWMGEPAIVRARAPLRRLLGYPSTLARLSDNAADLRMGLSHYAPIPPDPGKAA
jgi:hypothetical protein